MIKNWIAAAVLAWLVPMAPVAWAQDSAELMAPVVEKGVEAAVVEQVLTLVVRTLRDHGILTGRDELPPDLADCIHAECGAAVARKFDVHYAVRVTLFRNAAGDGKVDAVSIFLFDRDGKTHSSKSVPVLDGAIERAVLEAVEDVVADVRVDGPRLQLHGLLGAHAGARVWLDGQRVGELDYEGTVEPGEHTVKIEKEGYEPWERTFTVEDASDVATFDVGLDPLPEGGAPVTEPGAAAVERPSRAYLGGGITLIAAGVGLMVGGLVPLKDKGCSATVDGECVREEQASVGRAIGYGVAGLALVGGGVTWLVVGKRKNAKLEVGLTSLKLTGEF